MVSFFARQSWRIFMRAMHALHCANPTTTPFQAVVAPKVDWRWLDDGTKGRGGSIVHSGTCAHSLSLLSPALRVSRIFLSQEGHSRLSEVQKQLASLLLTPCATTGIEYKGEILSTGGYLMLRNPDADELPFVAQLVSLVQ